MEAISQKFYDICANIANQATPITLGILIIVVLIIGISLMVSKDARQNAMKWIPSVLIGAGISLAAVGIADAIGSAVQF